MVGVHLVSLFVYGFKSRIVCFVLIWLALIF